jgi:hypothetical protein
MTRLMICAAAAALALCGCKAKDAAADSAVAATSAAPASAATPDVPAAPPTTQKSGFDVAISLSPKAAAKLAAMHESIAISADYYGEATDEAIKRHLDNHQGEVNLGAGEERHEIPGTGGTSHFVPPPGDPEKLKYVTGGKMKVLINVFTARHVSEDNLLDCGLFEDTVELAERDTIKISCKLIRGDD